MNNKEIIAKLYEWSQDDSLEGTWGSRDEFLLFKELDTNTHWWFFANLSNLKLRKRKTNVDKFVERMKESFIYPEKTIKMFEVVLKGALEEFNIGELNKSDK